MNWHDDALGRMKYLYADDAVFDDVPLWRRHFFNDYAQEGAAYLAISASDPENLKGVDGSRIIRAQQASGKALKEFDRLQMCSGFPWWPWNGCGTPFSGPCASAGTARPWRSGRPT